MFGELLRKYRKKAKYTQSELAICLSQILGYEVKGNSVRTYENGINPKLEVIEALALILKIPVQFLFDDSEYTLSQFSNAGIVEDIIKVPLFDGYVGAGSAGTMERAKTIEHLYLDIHSIKRAYKDKKIKAIEVIGDSMKPYVDSSDIVLFSPLEKGQFNLADGKYIIETINGVMVKNLSFKTNGNIVISSCNKSYPTEEINKSESQEVLDIIGIVIGRILKN